VRARGALRFQAGADPRHERRLDEQVDDRGGDRRSVRGRSGRSRADTRRRPTGASSLTRCSRAS
jgi:hypothetical protein